MKHPEHIYDASLAEQSASGAGLRPGDRVGPYLVQEALGSGGAGRVYKVWDADMNRSLALKLLPPSQTLDEAELARFRREVSVLAGLNHPNIVTVFSTGEHAGAPWYSMALLGGKNLQEYRAGHAPNLHDSVKWLAEVARGVAYLHKQGVLHRDIKPSNILLASDGRAVLTDFGLATKIGARGELTATGASVGTPAYMAPEQARGEREKIGPATDVWQLGATLFAAIAGRPPHLADSPVGHMVKVAEGRPPDFRGVSIPAPLRAVALKAMQAKPQNRYESAEALADDLERWLAGEWVRAGSRSQLGRLSWLVRRYAAALLVLLVGLVVVLAAISAQGVGSGEFGRRVVLSAQTDLALQLVTVGGELARTPAGTVISRPMTAEETEVTGLPGRPSGPWRLVEPVDAAAEAWIGIETPPGQSAYGWGDFRASFEFQTGQAVTETGAPPDDNRPEVICFLGSRSTDPAAGVAIHLTPSIGRVWIVKGRVPLLVAGHEPVADGQAMRVTVLRNGLAMSITIGRPGGAVLTELRVNSRGPWTIESTAEGRGLGLLTSAPQATITEVAYQQLVERSDTAEFLIAHGLYSHALDRIQAALSGLGREMPAAEQARLHYLRGLCLLGIPGRETDATGALIRSADTGPREVAHSAALSLVEQSLQQYGRPSSPALRRARELAVGQSQRGELALLLARHGLQQMEQEASSGYAVLDMAADEAARDPIPAAEIQTTADEILRRMDDGIGGAIRRLRIEHLREISGQPALLTYDPEWAERVDDLPALELSPDGQGWPGVAAWGVRMLEVSPPAAEAVADGRLAGLLAEGATVALLDGVARELPERVRLAAARLGELAPAIDPASRAWVGGLIGLFDGDAGSVARAAAIEELGEALPEVGELEPDALRGFVPRATWQMMLEMWSAEVAGDLQRAAGVAATTEATAGGSQAEWWWLVMARRTMARAALGG